MTGPAWKQYAEASRRAAERHRERAEQEATRPYDGWGERPASLAAYWHKRAEDAEGSAAIYDAAERRRVTTTGED